MYNYKVNEYVVYIQDVVTVLLQHGADVTIINAEGHTAKSLTRNEEIIRLVEGTVIYHFASNISN